jgi:hypothetical protein
MKLCQSIVRMSSTDSRGIVVTLDYCLRRIGVNIDYARPKSLTFRIVSFLRTKLVLLICAILFGIGFLPLDGQFAWFFKVLALILFALWAIYQLRDVFAIAATPLVMVAAYCGLLVTDQGFETIRALRLSSASAQLVDAAVWAAAVCALWFSSALYINYKIGLNASRLEKERLASAKTASFVVPSLYVVVSFVSFYAANPGYAPPHGIGVWSLLVAGSAVWVGLFTSLVKRQTIPLLDDEDIRKGIWLINGLLILIVVLMTCGGDLLGHPVELPVVALVAAWLSVLVAIIFSLKSFSRLVQFSGAVMFLVLPIGFSFADLNDNHELPFRHTASTISDVRKAFTDWLGARHTGVVFIVASEGGGARAAYMTAVVLEELRIRCPSFQERFFAGVAVSGGSVGMALAAAAAHDQLPKPTGHCEPFADTPAYDAEHSPAVKAAGADMLRSVMRGFLLADLPMRFFPGSLLRTEGRATDTSLHRNWLMRMTDRAQYLEWSLDQEWVQSKENSKRGDLRDRSFAETWLGPSGNVPALVLLATDVTTGRRVAASHLRLGPKSAMQSPECLPLYLPSDPPRSRVLTYDEVAPGRDPTLIGAALVSARFPYITPAATLPCAKSEWRLVDGGYFENSGLTTALEIADELVSSAKEQKLEIKIVFLQLENGEASPVDEGPSTSLVELLTPFRASLATRSARAEQARDIVERDRSDGQVGRGCAQGTGTCAKLEQVRLDLAHCNLALPLGWSISEGAQHEIEAQLGFRSPERRLPPRRWNALSAKPIATAQK